MKKLCLFVLVAASLTSAQTKDNGSREYRMQPGTSVAVRFAPQNPRLRTATYHIKSDQPVTAFFTRNFELRTASKKDTLLRMAHDPCMYPDIRDADVSCDNPDNDTLLIYDRREGLDKSYNVVLLDIRHYATSKTATN